MGRGPVIWVAVFLLGALLLYAASDPGPRLWCSTVGQLPNQSVWKLLDCLELDATQHGTIAAGAARVTGYDETARQQMRQRLAAEIAELRKAPPEKPAPSALSIRMESVLATVEASLRSKSPSPAQDASPSELKQSERDDLLARIQALAGSSVQLDPIDTAMHRLSTLRYLQTELDNLELPKPGKDYRRIEVSISLTAWPKGDARAALVYFDLYPRGGDLWCHKAAMAASLAGEAAETYWKEAKKDALPPWRDEKKLKDDLKKWSSGLPPDTDPFAGCHNALASERLLPQLVYVEPAAHPVYALRAAQSAADYVAGLSVDGLRTSGSSRARTSQAEEEHRAELDVDALSFAAGERRAGWIFLQRSKERMMRPVVSRVRMVIDVPRKIEAIDVTVHKAFLDRKYRLLETFSEQIEQVNRVRGLLNVVEREIDRPDKHVNYRNLHPDGPLDSDTIEKIMSGEFFSSSSNWLLAKSRLRSLATFAWPERLLVWVPETAQ